MNPPASAQPVRSSLGTIGKDLFASAVVSLATISGCVSAASLLFQGALSPHLSLAIGAALLGAVGMALWAGLRSSLPLVSAGAIPSTVAVLGAITAGVAAECTAATAMPTAVVAMALTTTVIGLAWWLMGSRRWGDVARYIPYPVVGGFIASVGWLCVIGGIAVVTGHPFDLRHALQWLATQADGRLACGLGVGVVLLWVTQRIRHPLALPASIVVIWFALLAALWALGMDTATAQQRGWLLTPLGRTVPTWPGTPDLLGSVQWGAVASQAGLMLSALIVATISMLLSVSSLEVAWGERADMNRDLVTMGQANLALGLLGGMAGGLSVSRSVLNRACGAVGRGSGYTMALICGATLIWGGPAISLLPKPLLGGLLIYQGLEMLKTWQLDARKRLPLTDSATVWSMVAATALFGFLPAVCVGVIACCVFFAVASARLAPLRRFIPRWQWPTQVERAPTEVALLRDAGEHAIIVELQGVLFFGSAIQLLRQVEALLASAEPPTRLLFDFQHVHWLDSSAAQILGRLFGHARRQGVPCEASRVSPDVRRALELVGALKDGHLRLHNDIDAAVSAWDDAVLAEAGLAPVPVDRWMAQALPRADMLGALLSYFEPMTLAPGDRLFEKGEASDTMYLVQTGRLIAVVESSAGPRTIRTVNAGGSVGEMGLFREMPRSAHVQAEQPSSLLRLHRDRLQAMERERPDLAAAVYRLFVHKLADRLDQSTSQLAALLR